MTTLHIEHAITDFDVWTRAFNGFADARRNAGVREQRVQRPVDDSRFVVIDLDFESADAAKAFLNFLKARVWGDPESSPALAGTPATMILERAAV